MINLKKAPLFKLPSTNNNQYSLKESLGKYVVIYFYPKDDTPGCTIETNDFKNFFQNLKNLTVMSLVFQKTI